MLVNPVGPAGEVARSLVQLVPDGSTGLLDRAVDTMQGLLKGPAWPAWVLFFQRPALALNQSRRKSAGPLKSQLQLFGRNLQKPSQENGQSQLQSQSQSKALLS